MSVLAVVAAAVILAGSPRVEGLVSAKDSLGGLNGFSVVVDVDETAAQAGITRRAIATQVETSLRRNGVHVYEYAGNAVTNDPGTPGKEGQLRVELVAVSGSVGAQPFVAVRFDLAASQWVQLEADPGAATFARTWVDPGVLTAPRAAVAGLVRDALAPALQKFCLDYAAARADWLARQRARVASPADR